MSRLLATATWLLALTLSSSAVAQIAPPPKAEEPPAEAAPAITRLPRLLKFEEAVYPEDALADGLEADVLLELDIGTDGGVTAARVVEEVGLGFDDAALDAARRFVFEPALAGDVPVPVRIQYRYSFKITETPAPEEPAPPEEEPKGALRGRIREKGTRAPAAGVTVTIPALGRSAVTDDDGRFEIGGLPPGKVAVQIPPSQYEETTAEAEIPVEGAAELDIRLAKDPYASFRTVIRGEDKAPQPVKRQLEVKEIQKIPGVSGDALKAVQNLPGVARAPFGAGQIVTRGSAPEDTAFRVDDLYLPQLYHFGGIYSVFNTDLVETLDYYPGGFSVLQGGATAGLIDVRLAKGRLDRWGGYFDINVFHAAGFASGPVWEDGSLTLAARRSYIDAILPAVIPDDANVSFNTAPVYYDYQAKLDTKLGRDDDLRVFVFGSDDQLKLILKEPAAGSPAVRDNVSTHLLFHYVQGRWTHRFDRDTTLATSLQVGMQELNANVGTDIDFFIYSGLVLLRTDLTTRLSDAFTLRVGTDSNINAFRVNIRAPLPPKEGETPSPLGSTEVFQSDEDGVSVRGGIYTEAIAEPLPGLTLTGGVRLDLYGGFYEAVTVDPRTAIRWKVGDTTTLKAGIGTYHRAPDPDETSKEFGNPGLSPERTTQYSIGVEQDIWEGLSVDVQGFYKDLADLVASNPDPFSDLRYLNTGTGRIFGAEVLLRQRLGRWFWGWIAYTVSRSERHDAEDQPLRLFDFDQTHVLTMVASFTLPLEFEVGARFRYATGNPETPVTGAVFDADVGVYTRIAGEKSSIRIPDFHQLDLRVDKTWTFEDWVLTTYIEVQNVYNRANPEGIRYNYNFRQSDTVSGLPIIPGFGVKGEF